MAYFEKIKVLWILPNLYIKKMVKSDNILHRCTHVHITFCRIVGFFFSLSPKNYFLKMISKWCNAVYRNSKWSCVSISFVAAACLTKGLNVWWEYAQLKLPFFYFCKFDYLSQVTIQSYKIIKVVYDNNEIFLTKCIF